MDNKHTTEENYVAGIDVGSAFTKAVVLCNENICGQAVIPSGNNYRQAATNVLNKALEIAGLNEKTITCIVATGGGAQSVAIANKTISEITCQGRSIHYLFPDVRTVIDIGAQFSRVFHVDINGRVTNFILSEKCAAGSGRLLQVMARVLQVELSDMGDLALKSTKKVDFTTSCAVFIESEIVSRIAEGYKKEDIIAGVQRSLTAKVQVLAERVGLMADFALVGGTAFNKGLVKSLGDTFQAEIVVPPQPQIIAALGAALLAGETAQPS